MKFLLDAHLPQRLAYWLRAEGQDAIHTHDLPSGNRTSDAELNEISLREQRVVVTKDDDSVNSFVLHRRPYKLLLVTTGNISNSELEQLFQLNLAQIVAAFETYDFLEINRGTLIIYMSKAAETDKSHCVYPSSSVTRGK